MSESVDDLLARTERAVRLARTAGADDAEVYLWSARSWETREAGSLRSVQESDESGVGVRVRVDGRRASATTSGVREEDVAWAIHRAVALARLMPRSSAAWDLPGPEAPRLPPTRVDPALAEPSGERLVGTIQEVSDALARENGIDYAAVTLVTHEGRFAVGNTAGVLAWDQNAHETFVVEVRADGSAGSRTMRTLLQERSAVGGAHDLRAAALAAANVAREPAPAAHLDGTVTDVVLDAQCASQLLQGILPSFAGNAANESRSRFAGKLGQRVASELVHLVDDPTDGVGVRNHRVDDQGAPVAGPVPLIRAGVLEHHVHDHASAKLAGVPSTGHGLRALNGRYSGAPKTHVANAVLRPGDGNMQSLLEASPRAVLVRGALLGSFTMNPLTGDFSCTATLASLVVQGRVKEKLKPVTLGGNVFDALADVRGIANDTFRFPRGACPSIRVGGLTAST